MKLLMPLLHHPALAVVRLLDREDLVSDALPDVAVAAAADRRHDQTRHVSQRGLVAVDPRELFRALELRRGDFSRLDVVVVVPHELPHRHESEPHRHGDHASLAVGQTAGEQVRSGFVPMHERLFALGLDVDDVLHGSAGDGTRARGAERALGHLHVFRVPLVALNDPRALGHRRRDERLGLAPVLGFLTAVVVVLLLRRAFCVLSLLSLGFFPRLVQSAHVRVGTRLVGENVKVLAVIFDPGFRIRRANAKHEAVVPHGRLDRDRVPSRRGGFLLELRLPALALRPPRLRRRRGEPVGGRLPLPRGLGHGRPVKHQVHVRARHRDELQRARGRLPRLDHEELDRAGAHVDLFPPQRRRAVRASLAQVRDVLRRRLADDRGGAPPPPPRSEASDTPPARAGTRTQAAASRASRSSRAAAQAPPPPPSRSSSRPSPRVSPTPPQSRRRSRRSRGASRRARQPRRRSSPWTSRQRAASRAAPIECTRRRRRGCRGR